jgi:hypothetical protein
MEKLLAFLNITLSKVYIPCAIPADKQAHVTTGAVAGLFGYLILGYYSLILVALIAAVKEGYDYLHKDIHTCDFFDWLATVLGGVFILILLYVLGF